MNNVPSRANAMRDPPLVSGPATKMSATSASEVPVHVPRASAVVVPPLQHDFVYVRYTKWFSANRG